MTVAILCTTRLNKNQNQFEQKKFSLITQPVHAVFCLGFKIEGTFVTSPLKMRGHFQNLRDIKVYVPIVHWIDPELTMIRNPLNDCIIKT